MKPVHFLDFAATSAIRPPAVGEAMVAFLSHIGATPGRGGYRMAMEAGRTALRCRRAVARILGLPGDPSRVAFTLNATQGLNAALFGLLAPGEVVVTTAYDHNSVLRPVYYLEKERGVVSRMVPGDPSGGVDPAAVRKALDGARLLVVNAASNVLGSCLPRVQLSTLAREAGALVLVDAAQWAGHFPGTLARDGADLVAFTGHKGLLGPQGIGGLWVREGVEPAPFFAGGTGGDSSRRQMPGALPDRLEAGSANAPGMAGLTAGIEFLEGMGLDGLRRKEEDLKSLLWEGMDAIPGVRVLSPRDPGGVGIVTVISPRLAPGAMAERLDREWGVMVRYGLNCAPEVHRILGTEDTGAVRFSLGWASTREDVEVALEAVDALTSPPSVPVS